MTERTAVGNHARDFLFKTNKQRERERVVDGGSERLTSTELYTKHERKKRFLLVANTFMFGSVE